MGEIPYSHASLVAGDAVASTGIVPGIRPVELGQPGDHIGIEFPFPFQPLFAYRIQGVPGKDLKGLSAFRRHRILSGRIPLRFLQGRGTVAG